MIAAEEKPVQPNPFIKTCTKCTLHLTSRINCLGGEGTGQNGIMFVGEAPGLQEETYGKVFIGPAGDTFNKLLQQAGITRAESYVVNRVRCRPTAPPGTGRENVDPPKDALLMCAPYLEQDIARLKPKIIVPLGNTALHYFMPKAKISEARGIATFNEKYNAIIFPTYHPSAVLRTGNLEVLVLKDFKYLKTLMTGGAVDSSDKKVNYIFCDTLEKVEEAHRRLLDLKEFAFDIETEGLNFTKHRIITIAFSWKAGTGICIPLLNNDGTEFWGANQARVLQYLKNIFQTEALKIAHNGSFDSLCLRKAGIKVKHLADTIIMSHLLDEEGDHDLDTLSWIHTSYGGYKKDIDKYIVNDTYLDVPLPILVRYNTMDADATYQIYCIFKAELEKQNLTWLFNNVSMPLRETLIDVQYGGVLVDINHIDKLTVKYSEKIDGLMRELEAQLSAIYNKPLKVVNEAAKGKKEKEATFNINSPKQLGDLFFNKLALPVPHKTKTGKPSTDDSALNTLAIRHPLPRIIQKYRSVSKIKSTYLDGMRDDIDSEGRIHTDYKVHGTKTGRLSSSRPNLQNIPRDPEIKDMFIAAPGHVLIEADMAQHELRVLASASKDSVLIDVFKSGRDPHAETAMAIFEISADKIDNEKRVVAKKVNFGIVFGITPYGLASGLTEDGVPTNENQAANYINKFYGLYKGARKFLDELKQTLLRDKVIVNAFGRKRRFPKLAPGTSGFEMIVRQTSNFPIQSAASDIVSMATPEIAERIARYKAHIVLTIHDALVLEVPEDKVSEVIHIVKEVTNKSVPQFPDVPFKSDLKMGKSWGSLKKLEN